MHFRAGYAYPQLFTSAQADRFAEATGALVERASMSVFWKDARTTPEGHMPTADG